MDDLDIRKSSSPRIKDVGITVYRYTAKNESNTRPDELEGKFDDNNDVDDLDSLFPNFCFSQRLNVKRM